MEETKKLHHQTEKNETVVKLGGGGGIVAVVLFAGALATTAVATAFIAGRKRRKSCRKNQNRQMTLSPTALEHDKPSTETGNTIEADNDPSKSIIPDEKLELEINGEKEIATCGDDETLCYCSPKMLESNGISTKTFYAPVLCENLLFKPESTKIDQADNNPVNVEENIVEVVHEEEDGEIIMVDKTASERDLDEEERIITAENHCVVEQNILQHDKKEDLQVEVEAKTEEEMPCDKDEEIVDDDINGALEEELCLSDQNVENGEDVEDQDVKDENTLVELYGDDLEKDREETEMPFETIGGEDEEKVDHGQNVDDQEMEGKIEEDDEEQDNSIEDKTHNLSEKHFACEQDENESLLQGENVDHQEMEGKIEEEKVDDTKDKANHMTDREKYQVIRGKIEEDEEKVDDIENKTNDVADEQFSGKLHENESLLHIDYLNHQEMEGKIEDEDKVDSIENKTNNMYQHFVGKVDEDEKSLHRENVDYQVMKRKVEEEENAHSIEKKTNDMADEHFADKLDESLLHGANLDYQEMEGKIKGDEEKVDDIENKANDLADEQFSSKLDNKESLLHGENLDYQEMEGKIEEDQEKDEEKVDDIENKTNDMANKHFSGKPDENKKLLHEENLNYPEIEAKIEEDKSLKAGKYNFPKKMEGEYNKEYCNSENFSINKSGTKLGPLSSPTRKKLLIGTVSVVSWISWSWFFGLDFVKLCLIVLFAVAVSKIQGY